MSLKIYIENKDNEMIEITRKYASMYKEGYCFVHSEFMLMDTLIYIEQTDKDAYLCFHELEKLSNLYKDAETPLSYKERYELIALNRFFIRVELAKAVNEYLGLNIDKDEIDKTHGFNVFRLFEPTLFEQEPKRKDEIKVTDYEKIIQDVGKKYILHYYETLEKRIKDLYSYSFPMTVTNTYLSSYSAEMDKLENHKKKLENELKKTPDNKATAKKKNDLKKYLKLTTGIISQLEATTRPEDYIKDPYEWLAIFGGFALLEKNNHRKIPFTLTDIARAAGIEAKGVQYSKLKAALKRLTKKIFPVSITKYDKTDKDKSKYYFDKEPIFKIDWNINQFELDEKTGEVKKGRVHALSINAEILNLNLFKEFFYTKLDTRLIKSLHRYVKKLNNSHFLFLLYLNRLIFKLEGSKEEKIEESISLEALCKTLKKDNLLKDGCFINRDARRKFKAFLEPLKMLLIVDVEMLSAMPLIDMTIKDDKATFTLKKRKKINFIT